jgi:hypothetical protein
MLDLLALDHNGRLVVIELKADEDLPCLCRRSITGYEYVLSMLIASGLPQGTGRSLHSSARLFHGSRGL